MTQEEKAKAYDEAIEKAKKDLQVCEQDCLVTKQTFRYFPELAMSKDERIRKEIISFLKEGKPYYCPNTVRRQEWANWLEEQGQKETKETSVWHEYNDKIDLNRPFLLISQKRQLSIMLWNGKSLKSVTFGGGGGIILEGDKFAYIDELQEIQKSAEWGVEDEHFINDIKESLLAYKVIVMDNDAELSNYIEKEINWLKSLRPQNHWKPSDGQMKALDSVIDEYDGYPEFDSLVSLKNDLKKL